MEVRTGSDRRVWFGGRGNQGRSLWVTSEQTALRMPGEEHSRLGTASERLRRAGWAWGTTSKPGREWIRRLCGQRGWAQVACGPGKDSFLSGMGSYQKDSEHRSDERISRAAGSWVEAGRPILARWGGSSQDSERQSICRPILNIKLVCSGDVTQRSGHLHYTGVESKPSSATWADRHRVYQGSPPFLLKKR